MNAGCEVERTRHPLVAEGEPPVMEADFTGGAISSNGGTPLPGLAAKGTRMFERLAGCFVYLRVREIMVFPVETLVRLRIPGVPLGYADLSDRDWSRKDPVVGSCLHPRRGDCHRLAGKSALSRRELGADGGLA